MRTAPGLSMSVVGVDKQAVNLSECGVVLMTSLPGVARETKIKRLMISGVVVWGLLQSGSAVSWVINDDTAGDEGAAQSQPVEGVNEDGNQAHKRKDQGLVNGSPASQVAPLATDQIKSQSADPGVSVEPAGVLTEAEFDGLERQMRRAYEAHDAEIRQIWPDGMVTNAAQWVSYSEDFQTRRRVDFRANHIDITLPSADANAASTETRKQVTKELALLLGMSMTAALRQDPQFPSEWSKRIELDAGEALVFAELFKQAAPTKGTVTRLARRLMQRAKVGFYEQRATASVSVPIRLSDRITYTIPLPDDRLVRKAKQFRPHILQAAKSMNVPADLVYAIIHTESHFNPLARSPIPAYGLMQIVPRTAGRDATRILYDKSRLLSPSYLFDPEKNITVGAAYLKLLYTHYLKGIKDPKSRLYCAIAAYNTGVVNVARVFGNVPAMSRAAPRINALSSQQVLAELLQSLPARETRDYLRKVLARKSLYTRV